MSNFNVLKGGLPQGTKFGPLGFLAKFNSAVRFDNLAENNVRLLSLKYVDDMTIVESSRGNDIHTMQSVLDQFSQWADENNMKLNPDKCATMTVCFMKNIPQFPPLRISSTELHTVECVKILGVLISSNLRWDKQVNRIYRKASNKIYMLKLLKKFHLPVADLLTVYKGYIRPLTEYAAPVWNAGLTKAQVNKLETIQKRALKIILGQNYLDYEHALSKSNLVSLSNCREALCVDFATKLNCSDMFRQWLPQPRSSSVQYQLRNSNNLSVVKCNTNRYKRSPIPYFTSILNDM